MAGAFLTETDLMARWGVSRAVLDKLVESGRLRVTEQEGERRFEEEEVIALQQAEGGEDFVGYDEVLQELQLNRTELDELVEADSLTEYLFGGESRFELAQVQALGRERQPTGVERAPTGVEKRPTGVEKEPTDFVIKAAEEAEQVVEEEEELPTELAIEEAQPIEEEEEALFDFSEELAAEGPEEAQPFEEEEAAEAVEIAEGERAEDDLLGDLIGDVGAETADLQAAAGEPMEDEEIEPIEEGITDELTREETLGISPTEDVTAEITQVEEETFQGEDLDQILEAEEEIPAAAGEEEAFEVPYGAPVAVEAEAPMPPWAVVVLAASVVLLIIAALYAIENASSPDFSTGFTNAVNLFK